jgi:hypothetical protein|tara:strand:+ start:1805 stop:2950 length:1146 start_codon:yes stop_codon:yes gene_type:complete
MFTFRKGKLIKNITALTDKVFRYQLTHPKSGINIYIDFFGDPYDSNTNIDSLILDYKSFLVNKASSYVVFKEENNKYVIYKEFWDDKKNVVDNFKDAISFFENSIFEEMNEKPSKPQTPKSQDDEPEKFTKPPIVGDIVEVGGVYAKVLDVSEDGEVSLKKLTKDEAFKILRNKRNSLLQKNQAKSLAKGGETGSLFKVNYNEDKITIFEVNIPTDEPNDTPPIDDDTDDESEPTPDNVKDPFADENEQESDDDSGKGDDNDSDDDVTGGDDGTDDDVTGGDDDDNSDDWEFGKEGTDFQVDDIEKILADIKKSIKDKVSEEQMAIDTDVKSIEQFLSSDKKKIKKTFKNILVAKAGLGDMQLFDTNNKERLDNALKQIFK